MIVLIFTIFTLRLGLLPTLNAERSDQFFDLLAG